MFLQRHPFQDARNSVLVRTALVLHHPSSLTTKVISQTHQLPIPILMQCLLIPTVPKELSRDFFFFFSPFMTLLHLPQCKSGHVSAIFFRLLPERCLCASIQGQLLKQKPIPRSTISSADADGTLILTVFLSGVGRVITARSSTQQSSMATLCNMLLLERYKNFLGESEIEKKIVTTSLCHLRYTCEHRRKEEEIILA